MLLPFASIKRCLNKVNHLQTARQPQAVRSSHIVAAAMAEKVSSPAASRLEGVPQAPPDPILGVSEAFKKDTSDMKLNLGVGAYRTEEIKPYVLNVVQKVSAVLRA